MFEDCIVLDFYDTRLPFILSWCYDQFGIPATLINNVDEHNIWYSDPGYTFGISGCQLFKFYNKDHKLLFQLTWI